MQKHLDKPLLITALFLGVFCFFTLVAEVASYRAPVVQIVPTPVNPPIAVQMPALPSFSCSTPLPLTLSNPKLDYRSVALYGRLLVYWVFNQNTGLDEVYAYDMGPNEIIELDAQGVPQGDDRGFFLLNALPTYVNAKFPAVEKNIIVYYALDYMQQVHTLMRYDLGVDGLIGTSDDQLTPIEENTALGYGSIHIHHGLLSWQATMVSGPPSLTELRSCDFALDGNYGGCMKQDGKLLLALQTPTVIRDRFFADNPVNPSYVWSESSLTGTYDLFALSNTQLSPAFANPNLQEIVTDFSYPFALFTEGTATSPYAGPLYMGLMITTPAIKIPIPASGLASEAQFSASLFTQTPSDPKLIIWQEGPYYGTKKIMAASTNLLSAAVDVSKDVSTNNFQPAAYGKNVAFIKQARFQPNAIYYARCE